MSVRPLNKAKLMAFESSQKASKQQAESVAAFRAKFDALVSSSYDAQLKHFLTSFIFDLGEAGFKEVTALAATFAKYVNDKNEKTDIDMIQAADFLQKNGRTRTALQRKNELLDVDVNLDGRVSLTEYLLLHYKPMILRAYFARHNIAPTVDMSDECVGLTGVGGMLLEELFTFPVGLDPEIEAAIEEFMKSKREKEAKRAALEAKAAAGGVKGLAAKNELFQLDAADSTGENRLEITLNAKKRKAGGVSAEAVLKATKEAEEKALAEKRRNSRASLAARAALFEKGQVA